VAARVAAAKAGTDSHEIYKALQQAAGMVNSLYPKGGQVAVVHHEQRVSESPETFSRTQLERIAIPKPVQRQLEESAKKIAEKYRKKTGMKKKEKKAAAEADVKELTALIKESLQDWKRTREKDEKGKRTKEGERASAGPAPLAEIDLIAGSRRGHIKVHQMEHK
ncbi:MAG TPA: hypothetical protein VFV51_00950, partial [Vicinamibacterales bacterium]|nr:hypothetical protein [Vicinamibacterales bacterium]